MHALGKPLCVWLALTAMVMPVSALAQDAAAKSVKLEQIISREDPTFNCTVAVMNVGRDGNVYLGNAGSASYIMRLSPDGQVKSASAAGVEAMCNAIANADGVVAGSHAHFAAAVWLYDANFRRIDKVGGFLVNDQVGWDACAHVDVGASGDFYGMDQHRDRVVRITPQGKIIKEIGLASDFEDPNLGTLGQMHRVCEKTESLYVLSRHGELRCMSFDGKKKWMLSAGVNPYAYGGGMGGYDVDDDGTLYVIRGEETVVRMYDGDGKPAGEIKLNMGDLAPTSDKNRISAMSVHGDEIFIKRLHPTELFQRYDKITGELKNVMHMEHERLSVAYPGEVWQAGQAIDFKIAFDSGGSVLKPVWKVWARNFGDTNWRELSWKDNKLQVPADLVGVVHVKVSPELQPQVRGLQSEYLVQSLVAVVKEGSRGSLVVTTDGNRLWYGRGEPISLKVSMVTPAGMRRILNPNHVDSEDEPASVTAIVRLTTADGKTLASGSGEMTVEKGLDFLLPAGLTGALAPGRYRLEIQNGQEYGHRLTCVGKTIEIGPGMSAPTFRTIRYGDYDVVFPKDHGQSVFDATDSAANYTAYLNRMGISYLSERMGWSGNWEYLRRIRGSEVVEQMAKRLSDAGVMPAEAFGFQTQYFQLLGAYSAYGIEQMPVLLYMDASLPLVGFAYDTRTMDEAIRDLQYVTRAFAPYPAFTGWIYGNNWWVYHRGAAAARNDDASPEHPDGTVNEILRDAYVAAEREAKASGKWDPVLDQVANRRWALLPDASNIFRSKMDEIIPGKTAAVCGPYRHIEHYPPVAHRDIDIVDLQAQFEQICPPYHVPHGVDFLGRPGKSMLSHPEVWNDDGTGGQILPTLFMAAMRGSDSIGFSGNIPNWGTQPEDARLNDTGMASVYRALFTTMRTYGPWLTTLKNNDRVAILAERRMQTIDVWDHEMPRHFSRLLEAYASCLHAQHPATFVFAEEITPQTFQQFKALLLVDQLVELEPKLRTTLEAAIASGTAVFYDKTCRESVMPNGAKPLDVAFDKFSSRGQQAGDDAAYPRFLGWVMQNIPALAAALNEVTAPVATCDNPEILMSERADATGTGRYLWAINNTTPEHNPGVMWRVTLIQTARVPVVANIKLHHPPAAVYDVFAGKRVEVSKDGTVEADLRTMPARLYAMLDEPIASVKVTMTGEVHAGGKLEWFVSVLNKDDKPLAASVPVRVRLLAANGEVVEERIIAAVGTPKNGRFNGTAGTFTLPFHAFKSETPVTIEATDLFSGLTAHARTAIYSDGQTGTLSNKNDEAWHPGKHDPTVRVTMQTHDVTGKTVSPTFTPAEQAFGPHLRNMALSADGKTVLMNAMNWDENLYAVNVADGKTVWSKKVGHYFAFAPQALGGGFAVQGYDLLSAEGYHLYTMDAAGKVDKRFALFGLPGRLPHRFVPEMLQDRINNFAAPADGRWIASAGDMGLVVWSRDGKVLFQQDWHKTDNRHTATLAVIDAKTLLVVEGLTATAYNVADGKPVWQVKDMFPNGEIRQIVVSRDGKTIALLATCQGGRIFILRDGKPLRTIPTASEEADLIADGSTLAVVTGNQLKLYSIADGLKWIYNGDAPMRLPRFSPDDKRLVVTNDLGSVCVFDPTGQILFERDFGAKPVPAWLDNGDLLLATWMGQVCRLDGEYKVKWQRRLQPATSDIITRQLAEDKTPTVTMGGWTSNLDKPLPLDPKDNLLTQTQPYITLIPSNGWSGWVPMEHKTDLLYDGKLAPPAIPWLDWMNVSWLAEISPFNYLLIDAIRTNMKVTAVTLVEDKTRPESWLRDARLDYWDASDELWKPAVKLLSDAAVHSHKLPQPIEAARWRIVMPWGLVGNLRLGQIIFHGELGGCSHPDVMAKKPVAELFDERADLAESLAINWNGLRMDLQSAKSGNRSLVLEADKKAEPYYRQWPVQKIPNWDFEIVENPADGQYRYAQFAWKSADGKATGISLRFIAADNRSVTIHAGATKEEGTILEKVADSVPSEWTVVRVDLWKLFGQDVRIQSMSLSCIGGNVCFDEILLGKTEQALKETTPKK